MAESDPFGRFPPPPLRRRDPTLFNCRLGLRYEMTESKGSSADDRHKARIAAGEQFALDPKDVAIEKRVLWTMTSADALARRRLTRQRAAAGVETTLARRAALATRRHALTSLLEQEREKWKRELEEKFGKTFYRDRL